MSRPAKYCDLGANWFTGCEPGLPCWERCWARAMANRLKGRYGYPADEPFRPTFHEAALAKPLPRKPAVIALNFMGDWALASRDRITDMLAMMSTYPQHTFLTLTKRPHLFTNKMVSIYPDNVWLGTSASTQAELDARLPALLAIPAAHYWVSLEPILGPVDLRCVAAARVADGRWGVDYLDTEYQHVDWVAVGCESGPRARWGRRGQCWCADGGGLVCPQDDCCDDEPACDVCEYEVNGWTRSVVAQCRAAGVPVWVKQVPVLRDGASRVSDDPEAFPEDLRVQERPFPKGGRER